MTGGSMDIEDKNVSNKAAKRYTIILTILAVIFLALGYGVDSKLSRAIGNLSLIALGLMWLYKIKLYQWTQDFQHSFFPRMEEKYKTFLGKILTGKKAWLALGGIIGMLFLSFMLLGGFPRKVLTSSLIIFQITSLLISNIHRELTSKKPTSNVVC